MEGRLTSILTRLSAKVARLMSKDDDDEMDEQQRRLENSLQQVLSNQLVCENIASYLSLPDMKAASEVSRPFLQAIRGTRRFTQKAVLAITDRNLEDIKSIVRKTDYAWRGVKVDVTDPTDILEDLPRVLKSAEFVSLEGRPWMIEDRAVKDATAVNLLTAVLHSTPNFSQLKVDHRFLSSNVGEVLSSPAVQVTLRNLSRLDLGRRTKFNRHWEYPPLSFHSEDEDTFWRNFGLLTGLPNRLKCFKLIQLTPNDTRSVDSFNRSVLRLLRVNRATLEELRLRWTWTVWQIKELQTLTFPALKALSATVQNLSEGDTLGEFLKNQRSLEELTVTWWVRPGGNVYTGIKECSVRLKKLHLTCRSLQGFDWSFLGSMNRLKDFRLKVCGGFQMGDSLLAFLPKDQLECLSLEELSDMWGSLGFSRLGVRDDDEFRYQTLLLEGFRCLRRLSFLGSEDALDDQLMQWILKEFSLLDELELSKCSALTDAGITGRTTADWGRHASFADLRRLKTLKIVRCGGVTTNGVLTSCRYVRSLRSLEYTNPPGQIEESVVLELVEWNPRLERLTLDYDGDFDDLEKLKAKLKKKKPRVELSKAEEEEDDDE